MQVSIITPVLNEAEVIADSLKKLRAVCDVVIDVDCEIIVVDGGSQDNTVELAKPLANQLIQSSAGRAHQMNVGAAAASGEVLVFLHSDTELPVNGLLQMLSQIGERKEAWGRFNVRLSGRRFLFRIIEFMMNWRSRITGIATGDQVIFMTRDLFQHVRGFPEIPLMEDIEMSARLKKICAPICLSSCVVTSSRRWELRGTFRTIWLMWRLRLSYWLGADPSELARQYR